MTDTTELLLKLSACSGVSGQEESIAEEIGKFMQPYCVTQKKAVLGSLICTVSEGDEGAPHLLLDAHMDEVGLIVTYIDDDGFLKVAPVGGIDRKLMTAACVKVHSAKGDISGVVCSVPPHLQKGDNKEIQPIDEMAIDIGMNGEQAKAAVSLGDVITFDTTPAVLVDGSISAKALDDRCCCAAMMLCAEKLAGQKLSCGVSMVFATMEEIGGQGAGTAAYSVNPSHAIALDVSFAHSPDADEKKCGKIKKGPMIGIAPILDSELQKTLVSIAKENSIPYQPEVMSGGTGTDADNIAVVRNGVKTSVVSIPQRYMHSSVETVATIDVENTAELIYKYILWLSDTAKEAK